MGKTLQECGETLRKGPFIFAAVVLIAHTVLAYLLDAAGLIESLLSPSGARLLWILPLAVLFYALRITAYFIVPGVVLGALISQGWTQRAKASRDGNN